MDLKNTFLISIMIYIGTNYVHTILNNKNVLYISCKTTNLHCMSGKLIIARCSFFPQIKENHVISLPPPNEGIHLGKVCYYQTTSIPMVTFSSLISWFWFSRIFCDNYTVWLLSTSKYLLNLSTVKKWKGILMKII